MFLDQLYKANTNMFSLFTLFPFFSGVRALQAMGVYLYGELMVGEDARQQQLAHRCFELVKEHMDRASAQVVSEMLF